MIEINNLTKKNVDNLLLEKIADFFLKKHKIAKAEISLVLISDYKSRSLNYSYRDIDKKTDVLSFENTDFNYGKDNYLGEIFINLAEMERLNNYKELFIELGYDLAELRETIAEYALNRFLLSFIFIHGLLHLVGYKDNVETKRKIMINEGYKLLLAFDKEKQLIPPIK